MPVLRQRLVNLPLGLDQPFWVDDPTSTSAYHVREGALPRPGTTAAGGVRRPLHERPLDLTRPLWESYLITGLSGGRVARYIKIHHAAMDGVCGNELLGALMDLDPAGRDLPPAEPWDPPPLPAPCGWPPGPPPTWPAARSRRSGSPPTPRAPSPPSSRGSARW